MSYFQKALAAKMAKSRFSTSTSVPGLAWDIVRQCFRSEGFQKSQVHLKNAMFFVHQMFLYQLVKKEAIFFLCQLGKKEAIFSIFSASALSFLAILLCDRQTAVQPFVRRFYAAQLSLSLSGVT